MLSNEQNPPPDYNVLEPPSTDDDDYDDNIAECQEENYRQNKSEAQRFTKEEREKYIIAFNLKDS